MARINDYNQITKADGTVLISLLDATLDQSGDAAHNAAMAALVLKAASPNNNIVYGNDGKPITGTCTFDADTKDATATKDDILAPKTAYVNGVKVTGEMTTATTDVELTDATGISVNIPAGYYNGTIKAKVVDSDLAAGNIKKDVSILGVVGEFEGDEIIVSPVVAPDTQVKQYLTAKTYLPADFHPASDPTKNGTAFSSFTVEGLYTHTESNAKGTTLVIGRVDS